MAKSYLRPNSDQGFCGRERAVVFCKSRAVGQQICQQLQKKNMKVWLIKDEKKLSAQLDESDPELILIEVNAPTSMSIITIVGETFAWMRNRAREINRFLNSPSQYLWEYSKIILFKSDFEFTATGSLAAEIADTDDLVRECSLLGNVDYIGLYSSLSFIIKVRRSLE